MSTKISLKRGAADAPDHPLDPRKVARALGSRFANKAKAAGRVTVLVDDQGTAHVVFGTVEIVGCYDDRIRAVDLADDLLHAGARR